MSFVQSAPQISQFIAGHLCYSNSPRSTQKRPFKNPYRQRFNLEVLSRNSNSENGIGYISYKTAKLSKSVVDNLGTTICLNASNLKQ